MPLYEYTARSTTGQIQKGQLEAQSPEEVSAHLRKNRMMLVSVRQAPKAIKFGGPSKPKTRDIVIFTRQFATMINAGLPLVQSLTILAQQTENKSLKETTKAVVYDVESGHTLADAFAKHPKAFSDLYVNMVAAGEAGGILDTILLRLATFLEKSDALIRKVKSAMIYPGVIMTVAATAVAILLIFVIPTFQSMFASVNLELPLPTRIVIGLSQLLIHYWWAILGVIGLAIFAFKRYHATANGRKQIDSLLLRAPVLGDLLGSRRCRASPGPSVRSSARA
jgi:type IV pilus assembly protein PilC